MSSTRSTTRNSTRNSTRKSTRSKARAFIAALALLASVGLMVPSAASAHAGRHRWGPWHNASEKTYFKAVAAIDRSLHQTPCTPIRASGHYWVFTCD